MSIRGCRVAALLVGLGARRVEAQTVPPHTELRWNAPQECPDTLALLRQVDGFLGVPLDQAGEQPMAVDARVQGDSTHGYAAKVSFSSAQGSTERALEHPDCAKLTEGVALLIALAIDPERVRAHQEAGAVDSSPSETAVAAATPPVPALPAPQPPEQPQATIDRPPVSPVRLTSRAASVRTSIALVGLVGGGMLPSAAPGIGPELAVRLGHFETGLGGRFWAVRSAMVPGTSDASVELSLFTAGLRLCGAQTYGRWSGLACARGDLGRMSGNGEQVNNQRSRRDWVAGLGGGLATAYAVGRFSPTLGVDLLWAAQRPRFGVLRAGEQVEAFRPPAWQLAGFVGLAYAL